MKKTITRSSTEPLGDEPIEERTDSQHFEELACQRKEREQQRNRFLSKAEHTPRSHRRWFRIDEVEPDAPKRDELIPLLRVSIHSGDLTVNGKSQVLCLTASPLLGPPRALSAGFRDDKAISARSKAVLAAPKRLPTELASGEQFYKIVDDLWMSVLRWVEWFKEIERPPPNWLRRLASNVQKVEAQQPEQLWQDDASTASEQTIDAAAITDVDAMLDSLPNAREPAKLDPLPDLEQKTEPSAAASKALNAIYRHMGGVPRDTATSVLLKQVNKWIGKQPRDLVPPDSVSRETVLRVLGRRK